MSYKTVSQIRSEIKALKRLGMPLKKRPVHLTLEVPLYEKILDRLEVDQDVSKWITRLIRKELQ